MGYSLPQVLQRGSEEARRVTESVPLAPLRSRFLPSRFLLIAAKFFAAKFRNSSNQFNRNRLGERQAECAFVIDFVRSEFVFECSNHRRGDGIERVMRPPSGEIEKCLALQSICGDLVRDCLFRGGKRLANCTSYALERSARGFWLPGDVLVD